MKLYLASMGVGDDPRPLQSLFGSGTRVGVVVNAIDDRPADVALATRLECDEMSRLGFVPQPLDMRSDSLDGVDALWVRGGNTFALRAAIGDRVADVANRVSGGALIWGGYSAGAAILTSDLNYIAGIDDSSVSPLRDGLDLLDRPVIPHVGGRYPEGRACTDLSSRWNADGVAHYAIRDGEAIVIDGEVVRLIPRHG